MVDHDHSPLSSFDFNDQSGASDNSGAENFGKSNFRGKRKSALFGSQFILAGIGFLILAVGAFAGYYAVTQLPTLDPRQQAAEITGIPESSTTTQPRGTDNTWCDRSTPDTDPYCNDKPTGYSCASGGGVCAIINPDSSTVSECACVCPSGSLKCGDYNTARCPNAGCYNTGGKTCEDYCRGTNTPTPTPSGGGGGTNPTPTPKPACSVNAVLRVNSSNQAISEPLKLSIGQTVLIRGQVSNVPANYEVASVNFRSRNESFFAFVPNNPTTDTATPYEGNLKGLTQGSGDFVVNVILKVKSTGQILSSVVACQDIVRVTSSSPAPTPTPTPASCNQQCNPLIQNSCVSGLTCVPTTQPTCAPGLTCTQNAITTGVCRRSTCSGDTDCVCNTPTPTPTKTPTPTPTKTPTPTPTKSPTPRPTPALCNQACNPNITGSCGSGLTCIPVSNAGCGTNGISCPTGASGVCRNNTCNRETDCVCNTPTPTPTKTPTPTPTKSPTPRPSTALCNQACDPNLTGSCGSGLTCIPVSNAGCGTNGISCPTGASGVCRNNACNRETDCVCNTPTPTPAPACNSIAMSNGSTQPLALNQNVTFTCGQVAGATGYEFRIKLPDASIQGIAVSANGSRISQPFQVTKSGKFTAQCRACFGSACQAWEPWPTQ